MVFKPDLGVNGMSGGRLRAHRGNVIRNVCEEQIKSAVNCALKSASSSGWSRHSAHLCAGLGRRGALPQGANCCLNGSCGRPTAVGLAPSPSSTGQPVTACHHLSPRGCGLQGGAAQVTSQCGAFPVGSQGAKGSSASQPGSLPPSRWGGGGVGGPARH